MKLRYPSLLLSALLVCAVCRSLAVADTPDLLPEDRAEEIWRYSPGSCELSGYYAWAESGAPLPVMDRTRRVETLLKKQKYLEAFLWATAEKNRTESVDPLVQHVFKVLASPLPRWETALKIETPAATWYLRARAVADRLHLRFTPGQTTGELPPGRFSRADQLRLSEILLVESVDHIDDPKAERILQFQYDLDPTYERFCRWRAFAHHTRLDDGLLDFEEATTTSLPFPEILEDLAVYRLRRQREADAFRYLLALYEKYPGRWRGHTAAIRTAYKARLARLIEKQQFGKAMAHLQLSRKFPFEVLDTDMATYAIYYKLQKDQEANPSGARQEIIKFLLNHSVFNTASSVSEALTNRKEAAVVPQSYRAIMESELGNSGMTYKYLKGAVQTEAPSAAFFFALGLATERFKNLWTLAERCYEQSLLLDPRYEPSLLALTRHDIMRGNFNAALRNTREVLQKHPNNDLARYESARVYYVRDELGRAESLFAALASSPRARPDEFYFLARICLKRNDPSGAKAWLHKLLGLYPDDLRARLLLADCARAEGKPNAEARALESLYALTRPWRFDRMVAARLFRLAADRLARLHVLHLCSPTFTLTSVRRQYTGSFSGYIKQSAQEWDMPPQSESLRVESPAPPRWMMFDKDWADKLTPVVWRNLVGGANDGSHCHNELEIANPSTHEMLGVRIFADGREFAYLYRILPETRVTVAFRSDLFPSQVSLVYTTDTGFKRAILPEGSITRRVDRSLRD